MKPKVFCFKRITMGSVNSPFQAIDTVLHLLVTIDVHNVLLHLLPKFDSMLQYEAAGKGLPHDGKVGNKAAKVGEHLGAAVQADPLARL